MKTLLLMLIVGISAIAWRSPDIMQAIGVAGAKQDPSALSVKALTVAQVAGDQRPMTADEFTRLSKSDPHAYQKFINSYQVQEERKEVDKLMNFFTRGKYE